MVLKRKRIIMCHGIKTGLKKQRNSRDIKEINLKNRNFLEWNTGKEEIICLIGIFKQEKQNNRANLICITIINYVYIPHIQ